MGVYRTEAIDGRPASGSMDAPRIAARRSTEEAYGEGDR